MLSARLILAAVVTFVPMMLEGSDGLPMAGDEAETFLRDARIVGVKPIEVGITKPMKITLTDGERTHHAVWKSIDERAACADSPSGPHNNSWLNDSSALHG